MKVALCIFGQPRFLDNPHPFISHKKYILDKYDVDCYCHLWWKSGIKEFDANPWAFKSQKCKATSSLKIHFSKYPISGGCFRK